MADKRRGRKKALVKLPKGTLLTDISKVQWEVLDPIGEGGFGVIYSTKRVNDSVRNEYAVKVEPYDNGPMFVERNYFIRCLKPEMLEKYRREHKLSFLGLPKYISGGTHNTNNVSTRFLVMERFGENIDSRLKASTKINIDLLGTFCSQIVDSLMYIHDTGYVHMDIKPENLLLKYNSKGDQVYLIDFGVIEKCTTDSELKPDKKKQHNGTLLYSSRDSHLGVGTKRGDLEVLGYNILRWLDVELPWTADIKTPTVVQEKKITFMETLPPQVLDKVPAHIIEFLKYVSKLKHDEVPDYAFVKSLLTGKVVSTKSIVSTSKSSRQNNALSPSSKRGRSKTPPSAKKKSGAKLSTRQSKSVKRVKPVENDTENVESSPSTSKTSRKNDALSPSSKRVRSKTPPSTKKKSGAKSSTRQSNSVKRVKPVENGTKIVENKVRRTRRRV
ncbi:hypothetical protein V9T40_008822 [Parthenolecanium corni]|uniref:non-specific serine/threonine protein kinase n=1 Tax=Parthenolecanium corni TaxID=536013 RepID=A0AAN9TR70_9HEMI